jgi:hypothetical protein
VDTASQLSSEVTHVEHRGWTLQANWFRSFCGAADGWVCFASGPGSFHKLNIGRWRSLDLALEHGRAHVDRRIDRPGLTTANLSVQPRRS